MSTLARHGWAGLKSSAQVPGTRYYLHYEFFCQTINGLGHEKDIPTQQNQATSPAWLSRPHGHPVGTGHYQCPATQGAQAPGDRKSTRLNSSHVAISYAVFCLKKTNTIRP